MGFDLRFGAGLGNSSEAPQEPHSLLFPFKSHVSLKQTKRRANCPPLCLAEKVGFEPTHRSSQSTPLAGEPLIATWVFLHMAEMVGFEPTGTCMPTVFKTASLDHSDTSPCFPLLFEGKYTKEVMNCQWFFLGGFSVFIHAKPWIARRLQRPPDLLRSQHDVLRKDLTRRVGVRW